MRKCTNFSQYMRRPLGIQYMTLHPIPLNFLIYEEIYFLFYQCSLFLIGSIQGLLTTHFPFYNHFNCYNYSQISNSLLLINSVLSSENKCVELLLTNGRPVLEFWNNVWGLGNEQGWSCRTGPSGCIIGWWNRFLGGLLKVKKCRLCYIDGSCRCINKYGHWQSLKVLNIMTLTTGSELYNVKVHISVQFPFLLRFRNKKPGRKTELHFP